MGTPDRSELVADLQANVGFNVRRLRRERGWSQERLAELSGIHVNTITRMERGEDATVGTLIRLSAALECELPDFFYQPPEFTLSGCDSED